MSVEGWKVKEKWRKKISIWIADEIERYVNKHIPPSRFVRCLLENDLKEAFGQADETNRERMFDLVSFLYCELPTGLYGSKEKVALWLEETTPEGIVRRSAEIWLHGDREKLRDNLLRVIREAEESKN
jgi:hypothetical protein